MFTIRSISLTIAIGLTLFLKVSFNAAGTAFAAGGDELVGDANSFLSDLDNLRKLGQVAAA